MDWITTSTLLTDLGDAANHAAWDRFVGRFRTPIVRFACRVGLAEADGEEVAQEALATFALAYREGRYDRSQGRLSRWLFGIAYRVALNRRRAEARRARFGRQPESAFWSNLVDERTAADTWDQEWEQALLENCMYAVRQEVEPLTMRLFERVMQPGRAAEEVAREAGVPVKAVYNAKYTVLKRMRARRAQLEEFA